MPMEHILLDLLVQVLAGVLVVLMYATGCK